MFNWIQSLTSFSFKEQITIIEENERSFEDRLQWLTENMGRYSERNAEELDEFISELEAVLDTIEAILNHFENDIGKERATRLRRKMRNNQTRAVKARQQVG